MDRKTITDLIVRLRTELETRGVHPQRIVLYGSQTGTMAHAGGDIDVVVISRDFLNKGFWERVDLLSDAIYAVYAPIEAVAMTPEEWDAGDSMVVDFARTGEVLYAA